MKYVLGKQRVSSHVIPMVFPDPITHEHVAAALKKDQCEIVSAGFVHYASSNDRWIVSNEKSTSLSLGPDPMDETILNLFLRKGLAGLDLANRLVYLALQREESLLSFRDSK